MTLSEWVVGGVVVVGSHEVAGKCFVKTNNDINRYHFQLQLSHKIAKFMAYLTSRSCGDLQPTVSASPGEVEAFKDYPSTHGHLKSRSKSLGNLKYQYLSELLVNVCSHHMMVKSVSCHCMHENPTFVKFMVFCCSVFISFHFNMCACVVAMISPMIPLIYFSYCPLLTL